MPGVVPALLDLLAPAACPGCDAAQAPEEAGSLCHACLATLSPPLEPACDRCGGPCSGAAATLCSACLDPKRRFASARAALAYTEAAQELLGRLKYGGERGLARPLGHLLVDAARIHPAEADWDAIVPVPLHSARLAERGFNQSWLLAAPLGTTLSRPLVPALKRVRDTGQQVGRAREDRRGAMTGAFATTRAGARLAGQRVVLVDDVMTTGSTVDACTAALLDAGVAVVDVLTLARA